MDGTERGLVEPETPDTKIDLGYFIADKDPNSVTDTTNSDTDGDGIKDGEEDINHNGQIDEGESNPLLFENIKFIRRDLNSSGGKLNITDPIKLLSFLFLGKEAPLCNDAADFDDNERLEITDAITILNYLFIGGAQPPRPYPECGIDNTEDSLVECFYDKTKCVDGL